MAQVKIYRKNFSNGAYLDAFSLDPQLSDNDLENLIEKEQAKPMPDLEKVAFAITRIGRFSSFDEMDVKIFPHSYSVPEPLQPYREAFGNRLDALRKLGAEMPKNGPVAIIVGEVGLPLVLVQGGYYDFKATETQAVPSKLEEDLEIAPKILNGLIKLKESTGGNLLAPTIDAFTRLADSYEKIKGIYGKGKTIRVLFDEWKIPETKRARYLGCAHMLFADDDRELLFVQRARHLGVAADCISSPGSTPDPKLKKGFNLGNFMKKHLDQEMEEEFGLEPEEFKISGYTFYDDRDNMPFMAVRISTDLSTKQIAERCFGNLEVLKEHYVLYAIPSNNIAEVLESVSTFPTIAYITNDFLRK